MTEMMAGTDSVLPEDACAVSIMHMVNPATFWVSEPPSLDMTEERRELQMLEKSLQAHCRHVSFYKQGCYTPEHGEMVAVEHPKTHCWHRGRVDGVLNTVSGFVYKVFLVDHGVPLQVRNLSIQELPASCESLGHQALQVMLHGMVPVTRQLEYENTKMKTKVLDHWTAAAVRFVRKLVDESIKSYVVKHKFTKHMVYGDIYLELQDGIVSLKNELCKNEYAVFSEELFEQGVEEDCTSGKPSAAWSSTDGCSSHDLSPCRSPKPDTVKSEKLKILEYMTEYNERKKMKAKDTLERIEQWRQDNELFEKENADEDTPLGRGTSVRRRPQVTPGGLSQKQDTTAKQASDKSLLDLLDMMSGIGEEASQRQTDFCESSQNASLPMNESKAPQVKKPLEASKSINYMPAGAAVVTTKPKNKTHVNQSAHAEVSYNRNMTSFPVNDINSTLPAQLKLTGNSRVDGKEEKYNCVLSENSKFDLTENNKFTESHADLKNLPVSPVPNSADITSEHDILSRNSTDDGKADRLKNICQNNELLNKCGNSKISENSSETKQLSQDNEKLVESLKEKSLQDDVSSLPARPMSLLERLQQRAKITSGKGDGLMQNIMGDVVKSSQSKFQVQLDNFKSSEQKSSSLVRDERHMKTVMGLLDMLDELNPA